MAKYNNKGLLEKIAKLKELNNSSVRYGIFGDKANQPVNDGGRITVGHLARIHEEGRSFVLKHALTIPNRAGELRTLGSGTRITIPSRPFFSSSHWALSEELPDVISRQFKLFILNKNSINNLLKQIGEVCKNTVQEHIKNTSFIPLNKLRVLEKGHGDPLQDSMQLYNSVDYKVNKGNNE
jgi:hypothetical protein